MEPTLDNFLFGGLEMDLSSKRFSRVFGSGIDSFEPSSGVSSAWRPRCYLLFA